MVKDLVERLRQMTGRHDNEAADALDAKDKEIERLRALLREALWLARDYVDANGGGWCRDGVGDRLVLKHIDAALKEQP